MGVSARLGLLLAALVAVSAGCASQPEIYRAQSTGDGTTLHFEMNACHGDYAVTVGATDDAVRIAITDQRRRSPFSGGDDCSDVVGPIVLEQPLGDRLLVDDAHGVEIPVVYTPWNQAEHSEADFLAAVEAAARCVEELDPEAAVRIVTHPDGYPDLDVTLPELGDGESRQDFTSTCIERHIDPLRR